MEKLKEVKLDSTITLQVQCNLNEEVLIANFKIIMDCLRDLSNNHNDLAFRFEKVTKDIERIDTLMSNKEIDSSLSKQNSENMISKNEENGSDLAGSQWSKEKENLLALIKQLEVRTDKNEISIHGNTKDINLINKEIGDIKDILAKLHTNSSDGSNSEDKKVNIEFDNSLNLESFTNINKEIQNNKNAINATNVDIEKLLKEINSLKDLFNSKFTNNLNEDQTNKTNDKNGPNGQGKGTNANENDGKVENGISKAEFNELKEKVTILGKKTNGLELLTNDLKNETIEIRNETNSLTEGQENLQNLCNDHESSISELRELIRELSKAIGSNKDNYQGSNSNSDNLNKLNEDIVKLKSDVRELRKELNELKKEQNQSSKTSIDDEKGSRFDKASYTQNRFKDDDKLKELISRVDYLEKMLGSKTSLTDRDGQDKLPLIRKTVKGKERDNSVHEKTSSKKDISDLKAEFQSWINNYLADLKNKNNTEDLELRIQEIKNSLNKKADQEGLKKAIGFLEAKINQLYLFLTEPDGEDAMIVRKGFNCLSCSKKVEKLRGKIGPHINWNNMTATNYSPPKVGYSKQTGDLDREDDM